MSFENMNRLTIIDDRMLEKAYFQHEDAFDCSDEFLIKIFKESIMDKCKEQGIPFSTAEIQELMETKGCQVLECFIKPVDPPP